MDPNYAQAYAGMAVAYAWQAGSDRKFNLKAREAAAKALQIDDTLGEAHYLLGTILEKRGDKEGAAREYQTALTLAKDFGRAREALNRVNR